MVAESKVSMMPDPKAKEVLLVGARLVVTSDKSRSCRQVLRLTFHLAGSAATPPNYYLFDNDICLSALGQVAREI